MHDPLRVRVRDGLRRGLEHREDVLDGAPVHLLRASLFELVGQASPFEPLERHVRDERARLGGGGAAGDAADDVEIAAREAITNPALVAETPHERLHGGRVRRGRELQALDGHRLVEAEVMPFVDDARAAFAYGLIHAKVRIDHVSDEAERVAGHTPHGYH
jgi:hypothetical protein